MLTREQITELSGDYDECKTFADIEGFARAIEALVRAECVPPWWVVAPVEPPPPVTDDDIRAMAEWWPSFDRAGLRLAIAVVNMRDGQWSALQTKATQLAASMAGWQPIETAPKDVFVQVACPSGYTTTPWVFTTAIMHSGYKIGRWIDHANDDLTDWGMTPARWMPLPAAPGITAPQGDQQ